ncbi:KamA family radical SAM protein [Pseudenhygromyxa sp. WMMC2535]|uniref:KamA family radical SAM protein n=1 Tax=Pseudenhygromyxa sp. WMMC2535 TaxID=2712867 RepID=UPI0015577F03|nr:KamA family radical SAM protein [Pseudenhygromyxa sp. WMMC2535]NVB40182.1 KamA family radical SAM protein [Pseudenhygromyxa sp. WMMC2535]
MTDDATHKHLPTVPAGKTRAAEPVRRVKPPVDPATLNHRALLGGDFWRRIPAYRDVDEATFLDYRWQMKHSVTKVDKLLATLQDLASADFIADMRDGFRRAPMAVRVSPYMLSLIDWDEPYADPIRRQFIPTGSELLPDHPELDLDSLHEQEDAPVPGLTHRYPDKALFLALDTCPVYCRFCTRSYAVGLDTDEYEKVSLKPTNDRWEAAFEYIASRPELEDIVISGGDAYNLRSDHLKTIGERLLSLPNIRRFRFASKGPAVMPQKILTDDAWVDALTKLVERGRAVHKEVCLHTHFNHPNEITEISQRAMNKLFERGVTVRNQSVLQRGVNDSAAAMGLLVKRLSYVNVHPYYVYVHDLVKGVENLRTTVQTATEIEKQVRGLTAGFNTPVFVVDAPGGGGKRDAHSYDWYDRTTGVSVYRSPNVDADAYYCYFDPIDLLPEAGRARWADPAQHQAIIDEAVGNARTRPA